MAPTSTPLCVGYTATLVPNRTQQRRWAAAQAKVEVTEAQLAEQREARAT